MGLLTHGAGVGRDLPKPVTGHRLLAVELVVAAVLLLGGHDELFDRR